MWVRALLPPTITLPAGVDSVARMRKILMSYAPVRTVVSEQGRSEDATDPDGSFVAEYLVILKPFDEWPRGLTKEKLISQMNEQLNREFVGVDFNFSQYIEDNIEEALSGVKGENAVKIFGSDLAELERLSKAVKNEIATVPGVKDPGGFSLLGQPNLLVRIDRAKAARYGFSVGDINTVVEAAIGGQEVTRVYENDWNFPLTVRLAPEYRQSVDAIGFISLFGVSTMDGILLVSNIRRNLDEGLGVEAVSAGSTRMRQVFMTALSVCLGLVPAALSSGIGTQVQQPLATVVVAGMLLSPICSLLMIPTLSRIFMRPAAASGQLIRETM